MKNEQRERHSVDDEGVKMIQRERHVKRDHLEQVADCHPGKACAPVHVHSAGEQGARDRGPCRDVGAHTDAKFQADVYNTFGKDTDGSSNYAKASEYCGVLPVPSSSGPTQDTRNPTKINITFNPNAKPFQPQGQSYDGNRGCSYTCNQVMWAYGKGLHDAYAACAIMGSYAMQSLAGFYGLANIQMKPTTPESPPGVFVLPNSNSSEQHANPVPTAISPSCEVRHRKRQPKKVRLRQAGVKKTVDDTDNDIAAPPLHQEVEYAQVKNCKKQSDKHFNLTGTNRCRRCTRTMLDEDVRDSAGLCNICKKYYGNRNHGDPKPVDKLTTDQLHFDNLDSKNGIYASAGIHTMKEPGLDASSISKSINNHAVRVGDSYAPADDGYDSDATMLQAGDIPRQFRMKRYSFRRQAVSQTHDQEVEHAQVNNCKKQSDEHFNLSDVPYSSGHRPVMYSEKKPFDMADYFNSMGPCNRGGTASASGRKNVELSFGAFSAPDAFNNDVVDDDSDKPSNSHIDTILAGIKALHLKQKSRIDVSYSSGHRPMIGDPYAPVDDNSDSDSSIRRRVRFAQAKASLAQAKARCGGWPSRYSVLSNPDTSNNDTVGAGDPDASVEDDSDSDNSDWQPGREQPC